MSGSEGDIANSLLQLCSKDKLNGSKKNKRLGEHSNGTMSKLGWKHWKNQKLKPSRKCSLSDSTRKREASSCSSDIIKLKNKRVKKNSVFESNSNYNDSVIILDPDDIEASDTEEKISSNETFVYSLEENINICSTQSKSKSKSKFCENFKTVWNHKEKEVEEVKEEKNPNERRNSQERSIERRNSSASIDDHSKKNNIINEEEQIEKEIEILDIKENSSHENTENDLSKIYKNIKETKFIERGEPSAYNDLGNKNTSSQERKRINSETIDSIRKNIYETCSIFNRKEKAARNERERKTKREKDRKIVDSTLKKINELDSELFEGFTNCPNCKNYLKEITNRNYLHFSTMSEMRKDNEQYLLLLKNNQIFELKKQIASLQKKVEDLSHENAFLCTKINTFSESFIYFSKVYKKLLEENASLKNQNVLDPLDISEDQIFHEFDDTNDILSK